MQWIDYYNNLCYIDKVLLGVLTISVFLKIIKEIIVLILKYNYGSDKTFNKTCHFLGTNDEDIDICKNTFYSKNFSGRCDKENCKGYNVQEYSFDELISSNLRLSIWLKIVDWIIGLSAFILIIRTLLETKK